MGSSDIEVVFKALGDPKRIKILRYISRNPRTTPTELLRQDPTMIQSTLSHHMRKLTEAGLVSPVRSGRYTYYSINIAALDRVERFANGLRTARSKAARERRRAEAGDQAAPEQAAGPGLEDSGDARDFPGL